MNAPRYGENPAGFTYRNLSPSIAVLRERYRYFPTRPFYNALTDAPFTPHPPATPVPLCVGGALFLSRKRQRFPLPHRSRASIHLSIRHHRPLHVRLPLLMPCHPFLPFLPPPAGGGGSWYWCLRFLFLIALRWAFGGILKTCGEIELEA